MQRSVIGQQVEGTGQPQSSEGESGELCVILGNVKLVLLLASRR